ncbi:hypothetical protein [Rathayibacter sp. VKM Ac-2630]|nr:hypothetical protein [Rathayibacter sp. VKM Ac-2630]
MIDRRALPGGSRTAAPANPAAGRAAPIVMLVAVLLPVLLLPLVS